MTTQSANKFDLAAWLTAARRDPDAIGENVATYSKVVAGRNTELNALLAFDEDLVSSQVADVQKRLKNGDDLPLAGVPVVVKDNIHAMPYPTTCASKMLEGYQPPFHAHATQRLIDAGAILFGKSNLDEFAMGSSSEFSAFGRVKNPVATDRVPGGSSGGSAVAVASGMAPLALGSDTGGSIRQPAAFCGVVGMKPTYGRVSRFGLVAYASSLDQIGPFATSVGDAEALFTALADFDGRDSTSRKDASYAPTDEHAARKMKIGVVREASVDGLDDAIATALDQARQQLAAENCEVVDVSIPDIGLSVPAYYVIAPSEASANLARYDGIEYGHRSQAEVKSVGELYSQSREEGFGDEVKRRIMLGTFSLASGYYDAYYNRAMAVRQLLREQVKAALADVDLLLLPTTPTTAFKAGAKLDDPVQMYLNDIFTIIANLTELPAISIPAGEDGEGLPFGLQMMAAPMREDILFEGARRYERCTDS